MSGEFGTGKTVFVLAVVVGCFAVLWPKIFYPMLTASVKPASSSRQEHVRPERPAHLYPEMMHPALREKGRALPQRTIEKQARPGPMPGVRPPLGGAGGMIPPSQGNKGSGAMGIIMPLYTVGIIIFFVYTIMKVLFKKGNDDTTPKLKDFHLDPEYRKYVFAEEYMDKSNANYRQHVRRRDDSRGSRKRFHEPDTKIGKSECDKKDEQMTQLRRRLEETEKAMERLMDQMGTVTDKLTAAKITEVLTQAQAQAKILKTEEESKTSSKGSSPDMDDYEVINKEDDETKLSKKELATSDADATQGQAEIEEASCGALPARDADESLQEEDTAATAGHDDGDDHHDHHDEEETKTNAQGEQGSEEGVTPLQDAASSSGTGSTVQEIPPTERWTGLDSSREDEAVTTTAPPAEASSAEASHVAATEEIHAGEADPTSTLRSSRSADDDVGDSLAKDQAEEQ